MFRSSRHAFLAILRHLLPPFCIFPWISCHPSPWVPCAHSLPSTVPCKEEYLVRSKIETEETCDRGSQNGHWLSSFEVVFVRVFAKYVLLKYRNVSHSWSLPFSIGFIRVSLLHSLWATIPSSYSFHVFIGFRKGFLQICLFKFWICLFSQRFCCNRRDGGITCPSIVNFA